MHGSYGNEILVNCASISMYHHFFTINTNTIAVNTEPSSHVPRFHVPVRVPSSLHTVDWKCFIATSTNHQRENTWNIHGGCHRQTTNMPWSTVAIWGKHWSLTLVFQSILPNAESINPWKCRLSVAKPSSHIFGDEASKYDFLGAKTSKTLLQARYEWMSRVLES